MYNFIVKSKFEQTDRRTLCLLKAFIEDILKHLEHDIHNGEYFIPFAYQTPARRGGLMARGVTAKEFICVMARVASLTKIIT